MKKFDIRKWMKEQKDLPKEKRTLDSKSPIKNKKKLTEAELKEKKLLIEQVTPYSSEDNFELQGFNINGTSGDPEGFLYQCDGASGLTEINFKSSGVAHDLQLKMLPYVTFEPLNDTWTDVNDSQDYTTAGTPLYPYFVTTNHQIGDIFYGQYDGNANWVTPMDVIHYCANNPSFTMGWSDGLTTGTLDCSLLNGIDNCGGLWVGNADHSAVSLNPNNQSTGEISQYNIADVYGGSLSQSAYSSCQQLNGGWDPSLCASSYYSPAALGRNAALANCQGGTGACDDSWYKFGCVDPNSTNYNDIDNNSSPALYDGANWNNSSGGYSVDSNDYNVYVIGTDANGYPTFTAGSSYASSWIDTNAFLTVDGCAVNGIPDSNNLDCCNYIGCKAIANVDPNFPIINRGIFSVAYQASNAGLPLIVGYDSNFINDHSDIIGCESGGIGNPLDTTCCQVYGCPTSGVDTMYGFGNEQNYDSNNPTTWTNIGQHGYDTSNITVGCNQTNGYIDPLDTSCCEPPVDSNVGCNNPTAINYNPSATGCIIVDASMASAIGSSAYYVGSADSNLEHCCEYVGCDLALEVPIGNYVYSNIDGSDPGPTNPSVPAQNWGYVQGFVQMVNDPNGVSLGTVGCQDPMGGLFITSNDDCCITPDFGCPDITAYNYDSNNNEGCPIDTNNVQIFENISNPTNGSSCCEYIGCTDIGAGGGLTVANYGIDSNNYPLLQLDGLNMPILGLLGGNVNCVINDDPSTNLFDPINTDCCNYFGCKDPIATNHYSVLSPTTDSNQVIDTPSLCTYGGCKDGTISTITLANGTNFTYHLAMNYDPQADGCIDATTGGLDSNNYDCCNYYGCGEYGAVGYQHEPTTTNHMISNPTTVTMTGGSWNIGDCPSRNYDTNIVSNASNSYQVDPIGNWCCGYIGCPDNSVNPLAGIGMYSLPDGYYNAKNFEGKVMSGYDSNYTFLGCDSNFTSTDCCHYEGCNDSSSENYYNTIFGSSINDSNISCEQGFNVDDEINTNTKECCQYLGCADTDAFNKITITAGYAGCSFDTNGTIQSDHSCCEYVGCPDLNANNYGTHASWDNPLTVTGPGVGTDPDDGIWGCAIDSNSNVITADTNDKYICCNYNTGCPDPLAVQNTGIFTTYNVPGCPMGGCNYDSNAIACWSDTSNYSIVPWITDYGPDNAEGWGNIYDANGNIDTNIDNECCVYHWGCNDTNLNPFADPNAVGCYDINNPGSLPIMNVGEDNGGAGDPYRICCDPTFGCTDANLLGIPGSGFVQEAYDIGTSCSQTNPNSTFYDSNNFDSNKLDSNEPNWCCTYNSIYACNDPLAIKGVQQAWYSAYDVQQYSFLGALAGTTLNFDPTQPVNNPSLADANFWCSWNFGGDLYGSDACYGALAVGCNPLDSNGNETNGDPYTNPITGQSFGNVGAKNCCQYDYNCPNPSADNYVAPNSGQANDFRVAGCSANKALDTNNPGKYIGPADITDDTCCSYLNQLGCPDPLSSNYQQITIWSPNQGNQGCPPNVTLTPLTEPLLINDSNYDNCCSYTTGCPDPIANNYTVNSLGCPDSNDVMYDNSFNYFPSGNPNHDTCCTYTSACAQPFDDPAFTNTNRSASPTNYNWAVPFSNYDSNNLGCDSNGNPSPTNVSCCTYVYGCIDPGSFTGGNNLQTPPFDTNNFNSWGCNPTDSNSLSADYVLPDSNNNACCGDPVLASYTYQCNDPDASNYNSLAGGCADTNINHDWTIGTLINDSNNTLCCTYEYGCNDPDALPFVLGAMSSPSFNGCHPTDFNATHWNNTCTGNDCYAKPSDSNTGCCFYEYGCADPTAVIQPGYGNNGPGCVPAANAPNVYPFIYVTTPVDLSTIGIKPDPDETGCCAYAYGCTDPTAITDSTLALHPAPHYYDSNNLGCLDYMTPYQTITDNGTTILVDPKPNDSNFDCCKYEYTCPDSNSINYTGVASNDGQGCAASSGFTTSGIDYISFIKIDSNSLQCCRYPTGCSDPASPDYDSNAMGCPSLSDSNGMGNGGSYLYNSDPTIGLFPNPNNTSCCGWGCDAYDSNNPNDYSHPSTFINDPSNPFYDYYQASAYQNSSNIDWWIATPFDQASYLGPETSVCCANENHVNFSYNSQAQWESALIPAPQGCDCEMLNTTAYQSLHPELVGQGDFVKVDCLMGIPECNKCCLNTQLILDQNTPGTEIADMIAAGSILPFDPDDDGTWGPYMVPNLSTILAMGLGANIFSGTPVETYWDSNGGFCQCVDELGQAYEENAPWNPAGASGTVMEINCFSGYPFDCDVPCDSNDLSNCGCDAAAGLVPSQGIAPDVDHYQYGGQSGQWLTDDTGDGTPSSAKPYGIHRAFCGPDYDNDGLGDHVCDTPLEFSVDHCDCRFPCPGNPCDCYTVVPGIDWEENTPYCCADFTTGEIDQSTATMPWAHAGNLPSNGGAGFMNCPTNPVSTFMHTAIEVPCDAECAVGPSVTNSPDKAFYYLHIYDTSGNVVNTPPAPGLIDTWECGCNMPAMPYNGGDPFREATLLDPLGILYPAGTPIDTLDPMWIGPNQTPQGGMRAMMGCPDPTDPTKPAGAGNQHPTEDGMNDPYTHCCKLGITHITHGCPKDWFGNYANGNPLHEEVDQAASNWDPSFLSAPFGPNNQIYPEAAYQALNYTPPGWTTAPNGTQVSSQGSFCSFDYLHTGNQDDMSCCVVDFESTLVPGTDMGGGVIVGNMNQYGCYFNDGRTNTSYASSQIGDFEWTFSPAGRGDQGPRHFNQTDPNEWVHASWVGPNNSPSPRSYMLNEELISDWTNNAGGFAGAGVPVYAPDAAWINDYNDALNNWIGQGNTCPYINIHNINSCEFDASIAGISPSNDLTTAILAFHPVYIGSATNPSDNLDIIGNPAQFNPMGVAQGIQVGPPPSYNVTHTNGTFYSGPYPGVDLTNPYGNNEIVYGPQDGDPSPQEAGVVSFDNFATTPNRGTDAQPPAQAYQNTNFFPTKDVIKFNRDADGLNALYKTNNDPNLPHKVSNMVNMTQLMDVGKYDLFKNIAHVFNVGNNFAPGGVPKYNAGGTYLAGNTSPGEFYPLNPVNQAYGTIGWHTDWYGSLAFNMGEGPHWAFGWKGCYPGATGNDVSCCAADIIPEPTGIDGVQSSQPGYMNQMMNNTELGWYFPGFSEFDQKYTNYPWPYGGTASSPIQAQNMQQPPNDGTLELELNAKMCSKIDFNNEDAMSELFASLEKERGGSTTELMDTNVAISEQEEQEELGNIDTNTPLQSDMSKKEMDRLDRSIEYYDQLITYCKDLQEKGIIDSNANILDSNLIKQIPEYCINLPIDSPYLNPNSEECKKCSEKQTNTTDNVDATDISEQEEFGTIDTNVVPNLEKDLCACCEAPVMDTNIINVVDSNALDTNNRYIVDSNYLDPNMFVLDSNMIRIIDSNEMMPIDTNEFNIDSNLIKPITPVDTNIVGGETEEEKAEREERERLEKEKRDKEKKEKFQKDLAKYNSDIEAHKKDEWLDGKGDDNDLKSTLNHPDGYTQYFFYKPVKDENEMSPKDFSMPIKHVEEPKITKEELKRMVKNAIREIKKDMKNGR
tara:strand:+ start:478 stop:11151 length:10674 start_codon:yes stop_codon:yes gene_type:complete